MWLGKQHPKEGQKLPFQDLESSRDSGIPRTQTTVVVALKGPSYVFSPWEALDKARQGALYKYET